MTSKKKSGTNRRNAKKSTGPRTPQGKAVSKMNALRHGLTAEQLLIPGEDPGDLASFRSQLREDLAPSGPLEDLLADRIIGLAWRLRRAGLVEAGLFTRTALAIERTRREREERNELARRRNANEDESSALLAEMTALDGKPDDDWTNQDNIRWEEVRARQEELREEREREGWTLDPLSLPPLRLNAGPVEDTYDHLEELGVAGLATSFLAERRAVGPVDFLVLSRYETALERALGRTLATLLRVQDARAPRPT